jgi:hypothetical protein
LSVKHIYYQAHFKSLSGAISTENLQSFQKPVVGNRDIMHLLIIHVKVVFAQVINQHKKSQLLTTPI